MRTVDEVNTAAKRKHIMLAAMRCFARLGLQRTSMKDICRESRMTPGHLYYYFPNKNAIMAALFEIGSSEHLERVEHMLDRGTFADAIIERTRETESLRLEWHMSPGLRLEFFAEAARDEGLCAIQRDLEDRVMKAVQIAVRRGRATNRLDERIEEAVLAQIVMLIWMGLGTLRANRTNDIPAYEHAVMVLLNSWSPKSRHDGSPTPSTGGRTDPRQAAMSRGRFGSSARTRAKKRVE